MGVASHWYFREPYGLEQGFDKFDLSALPSSGQSDTDTNSTSPQLTDAAIKLLDGEILHGAHVKIDVDRNSNQLKFEPMGREAMA